MRQVEVPHQPGRGDPAPHDVHPQRTVPGTHGGHRPLLGLEQGPGVRQERLPVDGEVRSPGRTDEQPHPEVLLQRGDPLGDGLLGEGQIHGGLLELPGVGDRDERSYGFEVHVDSLATQQEVVQRTRVGCLIPG